MKYFTYTENSGLEDMEIFTETSKINQDTRAEMLGVLDSVISAGFLVIDSEGKVKCDGFSHTLSQRLGRPIESRGEVDEKLFMLHNSISLKMRRK